MANTIKTRILLRNDALSSWEAGTSVNLAKGEVAIATLPDGGLAEVRIGTGNSSWANSLKLNIGTDQVSGLAEMISSLVGDGAKKYQVVANGENGNSWKLQEAPLSGGSWEDVTGSEWTVDFSGLTAELCGISSQLTTDIGAVSAGVDYLSAQVSAIADDYLKASDFNTISTTIGLDAASAGNKVVTLSDIADIAGAMHFRGAVTPTAGQSDVDAIEAYYTAQSLTKAAGDVVIITTNSKEYVYNGTNWIELGAEDLYATKAEVSEISSQLTTDIDVLSDAITSITSDYALSADVDTLAQEVSAAAVTSAYGMASAYTDAEIAKLSIGDYALSTDVTSLVSETSAAAITSANDYTDTAIGNLDVGADEGGNESAGFVTTVTESNGKVAVSKKTLQLSDITDVSEISANIGLSNYALSADVTTLVSETSAAVIGESTDLSSADTVYGAKAYADAKVNELSSGFLILDCGNASLRTDEPTTPFVA